MKIQLLIFFKTDNDFSLTKEVYFVRLEQPGCKNLGFSRLLSSQFSVLSLPSAQLPKCCALTQPFPFVYKTKESYQKVKKLVKSKKSKENPLFPII